MTKNQADHKRRMRNLPSNLKKRIAELESQVAELREQRGGEWQRMLESRNIFVDCGDIVCKRCNGYGVASYADTSTYMGGFGGQLVTSNICDKCWGSGKSNAPWFNLRQIAQDKAKEPDDAEK